ncbi:response regulator [bacterium]|nr:response regulator [bacterium]
MTIYNTLKNKETLLIDDDQWIRDALRIIFESEHCPLVAVETAEEGMQLLSKRTFDVIICDYKLPGQDGIQFFEHIQHTTPRCCKILMTAYGSKGLWDQAWQIGVHAMIYKPFTTQSIEDCLSRLLQSQTVEPLKER